MRIKSFCDAWMAPIFCVCLSFFLISCKGESIVILDTNLNKSFVTLTESGEKIGEDNFLRFNFTTPESLSDIAPVWSLYQVRASVERSNKVIFKDIASGPFFVAEGGGESNGFNYSAYIFKSLSVVDQDTGNSISLTELDYDNLNIIIVYPVMGAGIKYRSQTVTYSKDSVDRLIANESKDITLSIP